MSDTLGVTAIVGGSGLALVVVFALWRRLEPISAFGAMTLAGLLVGTGALAVQDRVTALEWGVTLIALGVLTPMHAWLLFRRPGRRV